MDEEKKMVENQVPIAAELSNRDKVMKRLKEKYPDDNMDDAETRYGKIESDYADYADKISKYQDNENKLKGMIDADPRAASLLMDMKDGVDPVYGMVKRFGPELADILNDPDKQEQIAEAQAEYMKRVALNKELEDIYEKNLNQSAITAGEFQQEKGYDDNQMDELVKAIIQCGNDMVVGKFTKQTLEAFAKALNYDNDVKTAREEGEVAGRNAKIDANKLDLRRPAGDGLPQLGGGAPKQGGNSNKPSSIFDLAAQAK